MSLLTGVFIMKTITRGNLNGNFTQMFDDNPFRNWLRAFGFMRQHTKYQMLGYRYFICSSDKHYTIEAWHRQESSDTTDYDAHLIDNKINRIVASYINGKFKLHII